MPSRRTARIPPTTSGARSGSSAQRDQIIEHIATNGIEQLVFLTGDMHCCYHATMRIGTGSKYESHHGPRAGRRARQSAAARGRGGVHTAACTGRTAPAAVDYEVVLERFHSEVNAVMH